jgi:hypothetical protein
MQEILLGNWGPQIAAYSRQYPVQVITTVLVATTIVMTLMFGKRGSGSGDAGGCSFDDGDGGGCGD